ncbi:hypothetical protein D9758_000910 [Tetrapyrgos nigripes]|uniref:PWWP domain-containing protein n=1 Tax=Tetrapyrgos nigripes TaxID=182062 RepID=A0A8H5GZ51_9AGAR|nr:hypothetical protein D9758_000910 [Tetrapyrgos nigripes]
MPPRRVADRSPASAVELNSGSGKHSSDEEMMFGETLRKKGSSPIKYGGRNKPSSGHSPRAGRALVDSRLVTPCKRALDSSTSNDEDDLTLSPLSSLPPSPSSTKNMRSLSSINGSTSGLSFTNREKPWDLDQLGDYVWVLISLKGRAFDPKNSSSKKGEFIWWPAKVATTTIKQIEANVYGSLSSSNSTSVDIKSPCADNILSFLNYNGKPRFEEPNFHYPETAPQSPRKKRKHGDDIKKRWREAVSMAISQKQEEDYDGLPPIELAFSAGSLLASSITPRSVSSPKHKGKGKASRKPFPDNVSDIDDGEDADQDEPERAESPPPVDDRLNIPGEGVLCKDSESRLVQTFWPARIQEYTVIERKRGKTKVKEGRYKVMFLDGTEQDVPRDWFYADHQDEFATCRIGKFRSDFVENPDDEDSDQEDRSVQSKSTTRHRSPVPKPLDSLPSDTGFTGLTIHEQFCYTKPVLQAILNEGYEPARSRHGRFMKGGPARKSLSNEAGLRGRMDPRDVSAIGKYIKEWCLRDLDQKKNEDVAKSPLKDETCEDDAKNVPNVDITPNEVESSPNRNSPVPTELPSSPAPMPPSSFAVTPEPEIDEKTEPVETGHSMPTGDQERAPGQTGCPAYEALSTLEKLGYCTDVLLPETVIQLLLWRNGKRTSIELLSDEEENALHERGLELARETDWVFDIMRMRAMHEKRLAKAEMKQQQLQQSTSSS